VFRSVNHVIKDLKRSGGVICVVIEDMDSIPERMKSELLNFIDGSTSNLHDTIIIGTTNYPERLDIALINRPGRFDVSIKVDIPSVSTKLKYLVSKDIFDIASEVEVTKALEITKNLSMSAMNELLIQYVINKSNGTTLVDVAKLLADNKKDQNKQFTNDSTKSRVGFNNME